MCRVHGGMAPAVRAAADRRWRDLLIFERGVRERAAQLRDEYLARAALRSWVAAVVGREPAERGMAFVVDRLEAEAIAGGPPTDEDLAPYSHTVGCALRKKGHRWRCHHRCGAVDLLPRPCPPARGPALGAALRMIPALAEKGSGGAMAASRSSRRVATPPTIAMCPGVAGARCDSAIDAALVAVCAKCRAGRQVGPLDGSGRPGRASTPDGGGEPVAEGGWR